MLKPPAPTPQVKPKVESKPPLKPTPKPVQPKPKPKPPTPSPTKPKPISFEQFRKNHKLPAPPKNQSKPSTLLRLSNPNDFSLPKIKSLLLKNLTFGFPNAVNQYLARIKAKLESIWRERLTHASLQTGGEARLSFRISSNGTLYTPNFRNRQEIHSSTDWCWRLLKEAAFSVLLPEVGSIRYWKFLSGYSKNRTIDEI